MPRIQSKETIKLNEDEKAVLQTMFQQDDTVLVEQEFGKGQTNTRILVVRAIQNGMPRLRSVVKVGYRSLIQQEWNAYHTAVEGRFAEFVANVIGNITKPQNCDLWGIRYKFTGDGIFEIISLKNFIWQIEPNELTQILQTIFEPIISGRWQNSRKQFDGYFGDIYDRVLPLNVLLEQTDVQTPNIDNLSPASVPLNTEQNDDVQVTGFAITEIEEEQITLNIPETALNSSRQKYRLRVQGLSNTEQYELGQTPQIPSAKVVWRREQKLRKLCQEAVGSRALDRTIILDSGETLANPLHSLPKNLDGFFENGFAETYIHGDFNLENIILVKQQDRYVPYLIDFAEARLDYFLHDVLKLETEIIVHIFAETTPTILDIQTVYQQLHCAFTGDTVTVDNDKFQKTVTMVQFLRQTTQTHLYSNEKWREYYIGLIAYCLGTMKFKSLSTQAKRTAFYVAATLQGFLNGDYEVTCSPDNQQQPNNVGQQQADDQNPQHEAEAPPRYDHAYLIQLVDMLADTFDLGELEDLSYRLGIRYTELRGERHSEKVRDLVSQFERRHEIDRLQKMVREKRPFVQWPSPTTKPPQQTTQAPKESTHGFSDPFTKYELALDQLLSKASRSPSRGALYTYEDRLRSNIDSTRLYGDTGARRSERAEIIAQLNRIAIQETGGTFNDLVFNAKP